jgi:hypothetical protein
MARALNPTLSVKIAVLVLSLVFLTACRGEPVPRDYQNHPPTMTDPATTKSETPAGHGMTQATPEPTTGVEGTAGPYEAVDPQPATTTTIPDTPPTTT